MIKKKIEVILIVYSYWEGPSQGTLCTSARSYGFPYFVLLYLHAAFLRNKLCILFYLLQCVYIGGPGNLLILSKN